MEVVAFVFIPSEEGLLLVEQDQANRYWYLPGGLVEPNETIEQAAIREAKEEKGLIQHVQQVYVENWMQMDQLSPLKPL